MSELFEFYKNQKEEFISLISKYVNFRSYNGERDNINIFIDYLQNNFQMFRPDSLERKMTPVGDILIADYFTQFSEKIVLLAHVDTVKVRDGNPYAEIKDKVLYGNGAYDMKSGIALFYFILKAVFQGAFNIKKSLRIILNPDEESGSTYSKGTIFEFSKGAKAVLLPEPSCKDGGVKVKRKAIGKIEVKIEGKAAHSGIEPEKGIDANRALAKLILRIDEIIRKEGEVSFNPGLIEGGVRTNVVSPFSVLKAEVRSFYNDKIEKIFSEINKIKYINGAKLNIKTSLEHPALEYNDKIKKLYSIAREIAEEVAYNLPECFSGGASDGSSLSYKGIPVLDGLGIKGDGAHSLNEHIYIDDFPFRAYLLASLIERI